MFISEPIAWKHQIKGGSGSVLVLKTNVEQQTFRIAGIFRDFSSEQGIIIMQDRFFSRYWGDNSVFGVSLFVEEGVSVDAVKRAGVSPF